MSGEAAGMPPDFSLADMTLVESSGIDPKHQGEWVGFDYIWFWEWSTSVQEITGRIGRWIHNQWGPGILKCNQCIGDKMEQFLIYEICAVGYNFGIFQTISVVIIYDDSSGRGIGWSSFNNDITLPFACDLTVHSIISHFANLSGLALTKCTRPSATFFCQWWYGVKIYQIPLHRNRYQSFL